MPHLWYYRNLSRVDRSVLPSKRCLSRLLSILVHLQCFLVYRSLSQLFLCCRISYNDNSCTWCPTGVFISLLIYPIWIFIGQVLPYHFPFLDNVIKFHDDLYMILILSLNEKLTDNYNVWQTICSICQTKIWKGILRQKVEQALQQMHHLTQSEATALASRKKESKNKQANNNCSLPSAIGFQSEYNLIFFITRDFKLLSVN